MLCIRGYRLTKFRLLKNLTLFLLTGCFFHFIQHLTSNESSDLQRQEEEQLSEKLQWGEFEGQEILDEIVRNLNEEWRTLPTDSLLHPLTSVKIGTESDYGSIPSDKVLRILLVTTYRSGSNFVGEFLANHPGVFYHFEPLLDFIGGGGTISSPRLVTRGVRRLQNLYRCRYDLVPDWVEAISPRGQFRFSFDWNKRVSDVCRYRDECIGGGWLRETCRRFPAQLIKITRLHLKDISKLLNDKTINVRVIYLTRDPRGIINSRKNLDFCSDSCRDPKVLCDLVDNDLKAAGRLSREHPGRVLVFRYEDLCLDTFNAGRRLYEFAGLHFDKRAQEYLVQHSVDDAPKGIVIVYGTRRDTVEMANHWRIALNITQIRTAERECTSVLEQLGYRVFANESELDDYDISMLKEFTGLD